ncbi:toll-like receptor 6 [Ruditapes philippinarum]|uniref:toll-like receptor 6 n=1 Tax=Ruditapes philippinarum TaxID=129788 RepID=UPI00295B3028|nr:toll-like receptor 6 [Ruditapes philippinarum]
MRDNQTTGNKQENLLNNSHLENQGEGKIQRNNVRRSLQGHLPVAWQHMCTAEFKFVTGSNFTSQNAVFVSCDLKQDDHWSLQTYRDWISTNEKQVYSAIPIERDVLFAFEFKCSHQNAEVSLPWPLAAKYLWFVSVFNCTILDYLEEYDTEVSIPDTLKVVEFVNSELEINSETFFEILTNYGNVSKQYDCGSEVLEKYVFRNCTEYFSELIPDNTELVFLEAEIGKKNMTVKDTDILEKSGKSLSNNSGNITPPSLIPSEEKEMLDTIARFGQEHNKVEHHCNFKHLLYIDQSYTSTTARHRSNLMTDRYIYPALQYYNMSHSKVSQLSPMFLDWRRYFPKMKYLDLSYNKIKYFSTLTDHGLQNGSKGVLDLRHNNITTLTSEDIDTLRVHSNTVYVDLRNNPLHCDCKLTHFVKELKNDSNEILKNYKYLQHMKCSSPSQWKGYVISELDVDFCEELELIILAEPLAVLGTFVALLIVILLITIKCRKEIMILAFTRLNVNLPCRKLIRHEKKAYDAFIAYSEHDGPWVIQTLLPRLETPLENNGPGLKLCIHHRDFPIGGSIAENILEKVKDSHHTVLVLSNNFLLSNWCRYEFKTAFSQSLMERKRHLIMIMKEELDKHLIDADLNRCLKTFTFVKADDRLFWDKLIYALNDKARQHKNGQKDIQNGIADNENRKPVNQEHVINVIIRNNDVNDNIPGALVNKGTRNNTEIQGERINPAFIQDGVWKL